MAAQPDDEAILAALATRRRGGSRAPPARDGPARLTDAAIERIEALAGSERALADALAALSPDQRDAVTARVVEERGYEEIALAAHTSPSVIRQRVSRGLAGMRARLGEKS